MWFRLLALRSGAHVQCIRGNWYCTKCYLIFFTSLFVDFFFIFFCIFIFLFILDSKSDGCLYQFYQSHLYISQPILSAIKTGHLKTKLIFAGLNLNIEPRSFENQRAVSLPSNSLNTDFTKNNTNELPDELQHSIRFASLSLAAQNIFHDLIIRRIASFVRLIKMTKLIWTSWKLFTLAEINFNFQF